MDYAPVQLGYWNCQDSSLGVNTSRSSGDGGENATVSLDANVVTEMALFGGQSHCPNCRCFLSSLKEVTSATFNPLFPNFGLCYRYGCPPRALPHFSPSSPCLLTVVALTARGLSLVLTGRTATAPTICKLECGAS